MNEPSAMTTLLGNVTDFMSLLTTWVSSIIGMITGNPYLMIGFVIVVVSFAIGVVVRLVRRLGHNPA